MYRPVVIWSLDENSRSCVANWYDRMADEYKQFVRCVDKWEGVRDAFREFNTVSVSNKLLEIGVGRRGDGTRVIVVLVAYGMGEDGAYMEWDTAESRLDMLEREIRHVERHRVLIARYIRHRVRERIVICKGVREVPWLLSDRTSRKQALDEQGFSDLLDRLLDVLCFASRSSTLSPGVPADEFFLSSPGDDSVRLVGVPEVQIDRLVERVATDCAVEMAISLMEAVRGEEVVGEHSITRTVGQSIHRIASGQLDVRDYEKQIFSKDGLSGLEAGELLEHGSRLIERVVAHVNAALASWANRTHEDLADQRSGCLLGGMFPWKKAKLRQGVLAGRSHKCLSKEMLEAELAPLLSRLTALENEIKNLKDGFYRRRAQGKVQLPDVLRKQLRGLMRNQLHRFLRDWSRGSDEPKSGAEIIDVYLQDARVHFDKSLVDHLIDGFWAESHPETAKLKQMGQGKFYTFSAAVGAGGDIPIGAGVVRKDGPSLDTQVFGRIEYYPGIRSEMLLSSRPITFDQLRW